MMHDAHAAMVKATWKRWLTGFCISVEADENFINRDVSARAYGLAKFSMSTSFESGTRRRFDAT